MKCVGIQHVEAMKALADKDIKLLRTVHIAFVPDEEVDGELLTCFIIECVHLCIYMSVISSRWSGFYHLINFTQLVVMRVTTFLCWIFPYLIQSGLNPVFLGIGKLLIHKLDVSIFVV